MHLVGDVLEAPPHLPLCHAVSADGKMGCGAALAIRIRHGIQREFLAARPRFPQVVPCHGTDRLILNLVTKHRYFDRPSPYMLLQALLTLRGFLLRFGIREIAMTPIATGLDRIPTDVMLSTLREVFQSTPVTFQIYTLRRSDLSSRPCLQAGPAQRAAQPLAAARFAATARPTRRHASHRQRHAEPRAPRQGQKDRR
ncbi:hypothetical protein O181_090340 [Austropuccinia psidii MF-1]|uniref:Macro domain-containing protein n=1 Tax=Austropuccinia psidii MF-1 TaxID=1389203 RepID=A0A9Q3P701_9BASI|nr:hypothetical protein [Austropuccinia psidii MF-1]